MAKYFDIPSPALEHAGELRADFGLENHGLNRLDRVYWNLPSEALLEEAVFRIEGHLAHDGPFVVKTGKWTARAAQDKFVVREDTTDDDIWWGEYNRPFSPAKWSQLRGRLSAWWQKEEVFVQDAYAGHDPDYRMRVRIIAERAWHSMFARNMFITFDDREEHRTFVPEFTVMVAPSFKLDPRTDGTRSETAIVVNFAERTAIIAGTGYGGEIKKTVFSVMNFLLPFEGVLPMHCSANVGESGDIALFFGLSGTGKTTLSADPRRRLIGDDEHGWSDTGVFNFEGGCYAKVIRLSSEHEPEIYATTRRFGTILENVVLDPASRRVDLDDDRFTENTRASYPLRYIDNILPEARAEGQPENVILLTCDAQGVLPPIARLTPDQAVYHFMSGYTSKVAGTEIGLGIEPEITFSACFGAPFMVHHPYHYASMLRSRIEQQGAQVWLVNTGWVGGRFGVGQRISIRHTRNLLNAALEGQLDGVEYRSDRLFGFDVPVTCPDVPDDVLVPELSWGSPDEYWRTYDDLAARYVDNFKQYLQGTPGAILEAGPRRLSDLS